MMDRGGQKQVRQAKAIGEIQLDCRSLWNLSVVLKEIAETTQNRLSHQNTELENEGDSGDAAPGTLGGKKNE
ncbi:hypothetical protein LM597_00105 [Candidatus Acetothermia bacterium]|nr:hypothetical protein [Candidatus Acetothermia bacterium]